MILFSLLLFGLTYNTLVDSFCSNHSLFLKFSFLLIYFVYFFPLMDDFLSMKSFYHINLSYYYSDVPFRVRRRSRRLVFCEKRSAKPHTLMPVRSVQQPGNQRIAVHYGWFVSHQYEVRNHIVTRKIFERIDCCSNAFICNAFNFKRCKYLTTYFIRTLNLT